MTRIRASCPTCGEVDLRPDDVMLHVVRAPDGLISDGSEYRFQCPSCADQVAKPADERIAQLLTTGGVPVAETPPRLPPHPEFPGAGPPFTPDDLLDLHLLLAQPSWFTELVRDTPV